MTTTSPGTAKPILSMRGISGSVSVPSKPWQTSTSMSPPGRSLPSSVTTVQASPRSSRPSPGSISPTRARSSSIGKQVTIDSPAKRPGVPGIATAFQDLALCDNLDVVANLYLGREVVNGRVIDEVEMEKTSWQPAATTLSAKIPSVRIAIASLSGGQRQTVAIARSLLGDPKVVMLDEPTAALGVAQTAEVLNLVERLRERGLGVIIISHNMADVMAVADRVVVLRLGRTTATSWSARPTARRSSPRSPARPVYYVPQRAARKTTTEDPA